MGLNLANRQIARELDLAVSDVQALSAALTSLRGIGPRPMTEPLRAGLVAKTPTVVLDGAVEVDEVYIVAGHKGQPAAVAKKAAPGGGAGSRGRQVVARWPRRSRRFLA